MSGRQKKFAVLIVNLTMGLMACLCGLMMIFIKDRIYRSDYRTELSANAYLQSQNPSLPADIRKEALDNAYAHMVRALRHYPYSEENWRRLHVIAKAAGYDPANVKEIEDVLRTFSAVRAENYVPSEEMILPKEEGAGEE